MSSLLLLSNTVLKPSRPASNVLVTLTTFDLAAMDSYQPPMPSNSVMKDGLANALNHFPHLAGRFCSNTQLEPCILLNGAGVRLVETRLMTHLSDWLKHSFNLSSSPEACCLAPETAGTEELLHIQLNRFACGGMVIGVAAHHRVADGPAMSLFLVAWARLVQGLDVGRIPSHDRSAIATHRDPPLCEFNHQDIEFRRGRLQTMCAMNASTSFVTLKVNIK